MTPYNANTPARASGTVPALVRYPIEVRLVLNEAERIDSFAQWLLDMPIAVGPRDAMPRANECRREARRLRAVATSLLNATLTGPKQPEKGSP